MCACPAAKAGGQEPWEGDAGGSPSRQSSQHSGETCSQQLLGFAEQDEGAVFGSSGNPQTNRSVTQHVPWVGKGGVSLCQAAGARQVSGLARASPWESAAVPVHVH